MDISLLLNPVTSNQRRKSATDSGFHSNPPYIQPQENLQPKIINKPPCPKLAQKEERSIRYRKWLISLTPEQKEHRLERSRQFSRNKLAALHGVEKEAYLQRDGMRIRGWGKELQRRRLWRNGRRLGIGGLRGLLWERGLGFRGLTFFVG